MIIRLKSLEDIKSAKYLRDKGFYAPSVHASYYGTFLFMKSFLNKYAGCSYAEQSKHTEVGKGSHDFIYTKTDDYCRQKFNAIDRKNFKMQYQQLKKNRKAADYTSSVIDLNTAQLSIDYSDNIQTKLTASL